MPLANVDFIDGDLFELVEFGLAETMLQMGGLDFFDSVPTHLQMLRNILDGHVLGQFQSVAFKGACEAFLGIGELDIYLADQATLQAENPRHFEFDQSQLFADGEPPEG